MNTASIIQRLRPFLLLLALSSHLHSQPTPDLENHALLRLKSFLGNPPSLSSWSAAATTTSSESTHQHHCTWPGIGCTDGQVTSISLPSHDLSGPFPPFLCSNLTLLTTLDLSDNFISGPLPASLYNCSSLLRLNLSQNLLVGPIPPSDIDRLPENLFAIDLSGNNITGDIPVSITRLPRLEELVLNDNLFNGPFPVGISNVSSLVKLSIAANPFAPSVLPPEFGKLTNLTLLWMYSANLVGEIPGSFANLVAMDWLDLSQNMLNGSIPAGIWGLKNLKTLFLYNNKLIGEIPRLIGSLGLQQIDTSSNRLTGTIPNDFELMGDLELLALYYNSFSGEIPTGIGKLTKLHDVRIFHNSFTGKLPQELGKYSNLSKLEIADNMFSGELPEFLCAGRKLFSIAAENNSFTGKIPRSFDNCPTLSSLQLQDNMLLGELPAKFWSSSIELKLMLVTNNNLSGALPSNLPRNLTRLEMSNNRFSGKIPVKGSSLVVFTASKNLLSGELPSSMSGLSTLQQLHLDGNMISGEIPTSIRALLSLSSLNLSNNKIIGQLPVALTALPTLTMLDLSSNQLSGQIPPEMSALKLNFLNLSCNSLTGAIPTPLQNEVYSQSFLPNPGLCSSNPIFSLPSCVPKSKDSRLLVLYVVLGILALSAFAMFGLSVMRDHLRRKRDTEDTDDWNVTPFHALAFSETTIIRGLTRENLIGRGGSGQVYKVAYGDMPGEIVAVKKIRSSNKKSDTEQSKEFEAEATILGSIRHANVVKLLCCISGADTKLLVYEYMENGSLHQWLHGRGDGMRGRCATLDWPTRLEVATGVARGLCYMHHDCGAPVVHRDLKSSNILLDSEFRARVADFGLARTLTKAGGHCQSTVVAGSLGYMAPECAYIRKVSEKVDVYSFGVVLLELVTGKEADGASDGRDCSLAEWSWRCFEKGRPAMEAVDEEILDMCCEEEMRAVMRIGLWCTHRSPSKRPSMKEVLQVLLWCAECAPCGCGRRGDGCSRILSENRASEDDEEEEEVGSMLCNV